MTMVMEKFLKKIGANSLSRRKFDQLDCESSHTFGVPLEQIVERDGADIPIVVAEIFKFLEKNRAFHSVGIFRVNGSLRLVESLRHALDAYGNKGSFSQLASTFEGSDRVVDVYSVSSLLKLYLRELPGGLVPSNLTLQVIEAFSGTRSSVSTGFLSHLERVIYRLPAAHYTLLQHLCRFLHKVLQARGANKMSAEALGIVFGPNVFRADIEIETVQDQTAINRVMSLLIEHAPQLFRANAPSFARVIRPAGDSETDIHTSEISTEDEEDNGYSDHGTSSASNQVVSNATHTLPGQTSSLSETSRGDDSIRRPSLFRSNTNEFSIGIAAAIRSCIDEHLFRTSNNNGVSVRSGAVGRLEGSNSNPRLASQSAPFTGTAKPTEFYRGLNESTNKARGNQVRRPAKGSDLAFTDSGESIAQLTQRLHQLKTRLRDCEHQFQADCGRKTNTVENRANAEFNSLLAEVSEIRLALKRTRLSGQRRGTVDHLGQAGGAWEPGYGEEAEEENSEEDVDTGGCESETVQGRDHHRFATTDTYRSLPQLPEPCHVTACVSGTRRGLPTVENGAPDSAEKQVWPNGGHPLAQTATALMTAPRLARELGTERDEGGRAELHSVQLTYNLLTGRLAEKRALANRPDSLGAMTLKQVEAEKLALQKALLYFENLHGRPTSRQERLLMRPLYDRYRSVKRLLAAQGRGSGAKPYFSFPRDSAEAECSDTLTGTARSAVGQLSMLQHVNDAVGLGEDETTTCADHLSSHNGQDCLTEAVEAEEEEFRYPLSAKYTTSNLSGDQADVVWSLHGSVVRRVGRRPWQPTGLPCRSVGPRSSGQLCRGQLDAGHAQVESAKPVSKGADTVGRDLGTGDLPDRRRSSDKSRGDFEQHNHRLTAGNGDNPTTTTSGPRRTLSAASGGVSPSPSSASSRSTSSSCCPGDGDQRMSPLPFSPTEATAQPSWASPPPTLPDYAQMGRGAVGAESPQHRGRRSLPAPSLLLAKSGGQEGQGAHNVFLRNVNQLKSELQSARESKLRLQKTLKDFEHDFLQITGRKVERADRLPMRSEYNQYKLLKDRISDLETQLKSQPF